MQTRQFKGCIGHPEFGFGFIADTLQQQQGYADFHLHPASDLFFRSVSLAEALPSEASVNNFAPPVWNQGGTGSCGGHGTAGAVTTTFASKGVRLPTPVTPRMLYTLARAGDRASPAVPLQDVGTSPNALVRALETWGAPLESEIPGERSAADADYSIWLEEHVNDEPRLGELQAANARPLINFNAIYATGSLLRDQVCAAIAAGYAVMAAVEAGSAAFQNFHGEGALGFTGSNPDHWVYFTAFRTIDGEKQILMRNSWGLGIWTPDGCAWCNEDFITRGMFYPLVANLGL